MDVRMARGNEIEIGSGENEGVNFQNLVSYLGVNKSEGSRGGWNLA
jgi:hypothetical protein